MSRFLARSVAGVCLVRPTWRVTTNKRDNSRLRAAPECRPTE
jgi:hypothetical protein